MNIVFNILTALTFILVSGCSNVDVHQEPTVARILVTHQDVQFLPIQAEIPKFIDYSVMSELTYNDTLYSAPAAEVDELVTRAVTGRCVSRCFADDRAEKLIRKWRLIYTYRTPGTAGGGLGLQIWAERGSICREVVIAIRGTDPGDRADLQSNLHWLGRIAGLQDEYDTVDENIGGLIDWIRSLPCFSIRSRIVMAGHSLGGGLAQHAGYYDSRIASIFVIDPSFVTGSWDLSKRRLESNSHGRVVTRVYEHGEILAYPRFVLRNISPPSEADPRIENVRVNVIEGNIVRQHRLRIFDTCLLNAMAIHDGKAQDRASAPRVGTRVAGMTCQYSTETHNPRRRTAG